MPINELNDMNIGFQEMVIRNRYLMVDELVQVSYVKTLSTSNIEGIIFVFDKDDIVEGI